MRKQASAKQASAKQADQPQDFDNRHEILA